MKCAYCDNWEKDTAENSEDQIKYDTFRQNLKKCKTTDFSNSILFPLKKIIDVNLEKE